jgi:hypothetical protein
MQKEAQANRMESQNFKQSAAPTQQFTGGGFNLAI